MDEAGAKAYLAHGAAERVLSRRGMIAVVKTDLSGLYRDYIARLNAQDWPKLGHFVHDGVIHNGRLIGSSGYRAMLERDFDDIPDLFQCAVAGC